MAKRGKDEAPNPNRVTNRDIIQRLNFLYQASVYLSSIPNQVQPITSKLYSGKEKKKPTVRKDGKKKLKPTRRVTASDLSKTYLSTMKAVGQKTTVKIDPNVKRTICKGCNRALIPGSTASIRVKKSTSHGQCMVYTCNGCKTSRRIPAPPTLKSNVPLTLDPAPILTDTTDPSISDGGSTRSTSARSATQIADEKKGLYARSVKPRLPPLFARETGHVIFCGNERLPNSEPERGNGIFVS
ncbi:RNAse P Rpr2/Rpp21/SNM1 subunit domain-containing protein [Collybia nuda]|uniref:RNAse P Rpr2/Rpp21/SNM1 subunit domain-containing protein n=1 Tax=Collybia nuda TaxID=64659 RepID=A0A9P6CP86_9AGAR|nr:RNAse P Rpr2/Rpp21/SNM1 subunit domain-containing protein [Collybia nuda]